MKSQTNKTNIFDVAKKAHIDEGFLIPFGYDKAKIDLSINDALRDNKDGKLILVTAITPSKAGEGKTTTSIALHDGFHKIGVESLLCLREPSLGPVFGIKGGATGGGKASITPSDDINLHFTGDMHALTSSINLIAAVIDNSIYQGNEFNINPERIVWKRALDMNDRALRDVLVMSDERKGIRRKDEFVITVASEMMAIMCLSKDKQDFLDRVNEIIVAYTFDNKPVRVRDLRISHAIYKLMKNALNPNLVQTLYGNPVLVHGGPFANIAHGCNSLIATKLALKLAPVVITEAGFAADLGAEKFFDIKCRVGNLKPSLVVMVATIRALKMHGGVPFAEVDNENILALKEGLKNLKQHMENIEKYHVNAVVCINHFSSDTEKETEVLNTWCKEQGYKVAYCSAFSDGEDGAVELAKVCKEALENNTSDFKCLYDENLPIKDKIEIVAKEIYRARSVQYTPEALKDLEDINALGYTKTPVCIAKTPQSFTDNPKLLNAPRDFDITIREIRLSAGANFVVPLTGKVMTMPGLSKLPSAVKMEDEKIDL